MGVYFRDRDDIFAPDRFVTLEQAIIECAKYYLKKDLSAFIISSSLDPRLLNQDFHDNSLRNEQTLIKAWGILRSLLYDGHIKAGSIDSDTGEMGDIPQSFWGSRFATHALEDGRVPYADGTKEFCGKIVINRAGVEFYFSGATVDNDVKYRNIMKYVEQNCEDIDASVTYLPLGYLNICDAFDCVLDAKTAKAKKDGKLSGSFAMQVTKEDKIASDVHNLIMNSLEDGKIFAYHYDNDGKIRKIHSDDWSAGDDDNFYVANNIRFKVIRPSRKYTNEHRWSYSIGIEVDGVLVHGKILIGIEELASIMSDEEISELVEEYVIKIDEEDIDNNDEPKEATVINIDTKKRGKKPTFDKDLFMWEAIKVLVFEEGPFPTEEAHGLRASERYAAITGAKGPGDTWSGEQIKDLWKKLDVEGNLKKARRDSAKG